MVVSRGIHRPHWVVGRRERSQRAFLHAASDFCCPRSRRIHGNDCCSLVAVHHVDTLNLPDHLRWWIVGHRLATLPDEGSGQDQEMSQIAQSI